MRRYSPASPIEPADSQAAENMDVPPSSGGGTQYAPAAGQECTLPGVYGRENQQVVNAPSELEDQGDDESYCESESDEEEVLRQFGIYQCLPVGDGEPDFEAGEPTTAEEYLRRVR